MNRHHRRCCRVTLSAMEVNNSGRYAMEVNSSYHSATEANSSGRCGMAEACIAVHCGLPACAVEAANNASRFRESRGPENR